MKNLADEFEYKTVKEKGTGFQEPNIIKEINYKFDKFLISVKLGMNNEFIGITDVKINKDFLSYKEKSVIKGYLDVEKFYKD